MSSFDQPHFFYLFALRSGKKKLAYGPTPEAALETLRLRLNDEEFAQIDTARFDRIRQHELQKYAGQLG